MGVKATERPLFALIRGREAGVIAAGKYAEWLTPEGLTLLEQWAREGLTDELIAREKMGISRSTLKEWKSKYPDISAALKKGKQLADANVESALYRAACGYSYDETTAETTTGPGGEERTVIRRVTKHMPPNATAAIYWLNNRRPDRWRAKPQADASDTLNRLDALLEEAKRAAYTETG